jgi:hypothetical protein
MSGIPLGQSSPLRMSFFYAFFLCERGICAFAYWQQTSQQCVQLCGPRYPRRSLIISVDSILSYHEQIALLTPPSDRMGEFFYVTREDERADPTACPD